MTSNSAARIPRHRRGLSVRTVAVLLAVASCALAFGTPAAFAGVGISVSPQLSTQAGPLRVGSTYQGNILIGNANTAGQGSDADTISGIQITPTCGEQLDSSITCDGTNPPQDPGVVSIAATGTGSSTNGSCGGTSFTFTLLAAPNPAGTYSVTPDTPTGTLTVPAGQACEIDFTFTVDSVPPNTVSAPAGDPAPPPDSVITIAAAQAVDAVAPGLHATATGTSEASICATVTQCAITAGGHGSPSIQVTVQNSATGVRSIAVTTSFNSTVSIPAFTSGTTTPIVVTATRITPGEDANVGLAVTDGAGAVTYCEPGYVRLRGTGRLSTQRITGVARTEHYLEIANDGLSRLTVFVDGKRAGSYAHLATHAKLSETIASKYLTARRNTIVVTAVGRARASALVLVGDHL